MNWELESFEKGQASQEREQISVMGLVTIERASPRITEDFDKVCLMKKKMNKEQEVKCYFSVFWLKVLIFGFLS